MDGSISFTLQGKRGGFGVNAIFLNGNNQSKWFLLGLAACLEGLPWGEGCHENKLGVTLAQSSLQLQVCAKDAPPLHPEFCGAALSALGVLPGAGSVSAWGS